MSRRAHGGGRGHWRLVVAVLLGLAVGGGVFAAVRAVAVPQPPTVSLSNGTSTPIFDVEIVASGEVKARRERIEPGERFETTFDNGFPERLRVRLRRASGTIDRISLEPRRNIDRVIAVRVRAGRRVHVQRLRAR